MAMIISKRKKGLFDDDDDDNNDLFDVCKRIVEPGKFPSPAKLSDRQQQLDNKKQLPIKKLFYME
jgi:hypothetical protein